VSETPKTWARHLYTVLVRLSARLAPSTLDESKWWPTASSSSRSGWVRPVGLRLIADARSRARLQECDHDRQTEKPLRHRAHAVDCGRVARSPGRGSSSKFSTVFARSARTGRVLRAATPCIAVLAWLNRELSGCRPMLEACGQQTAPRSVTSGVVLTPSGPWCD
jgi:hypothetical protein